MILSYYKFINYFGFLLLFVFLGFFQSAVWPMTVAIMGQEYSHNSRGKIIGIWSINSAVGDMLGYLYSSLMLSEGISWVMISLLSLLIFSSVNIISWIFLKKTPQIEMKPRIKIIDALKLPTVFNYCACYACIKLMYLGILIWIPYYLEVGLRYTM